MWWLAIVSYLLIALFFWLVSLYRLIDEDGNFLLGVVFVTLLSLLWLPVGVYIYSTNR